MRVKFQSSHLTDHVSWIAIWWWVWRKQRHPWGPTCHLWRHPRHWSWYECWYSWCWRWRQLILRLQHLSFFSFPRGRDVAPPSLSINQMFFQCGSPFFFFNAFPWGPTCRLWRHPCHWSWHECWYSWCWRWRQLILRLQHLSFFAFPRGRDVAHPSLSINQMFFLLNIYFFNVERSITINKLVIGQIKII